jgi:hypothetical protein
MRTSEHGASVTTPSTPILTVQQAQCEVRVITDLSGAGSDAQRFAARHRLAVSSGFFLDAEVWKLTRKIH